MVHIHVRLLPSVTRGIRPGFSQSGSVPVTRVKGHQVKEVGGFWGFRLKDPRGTHLLVLGVCVGIRGHISVRSVK